MAEFENAGIAGAKPHPEGMWTATVEDAHVVRDHFSRSPIRLKLKTKAGVVWLGLNGYNIHEVAAALGDVTLTPDMSAVVGADAFRASKGKIRITVTHRVFASVELAP